MTAELVRRYQAGETVKALAAEFSMHHRTVKAWLERAGVTIRLRDHKLTDEQIASAIELYAEGLSTAKIGNQLGVSHNLIIRRLREAGVQMRPTGRPPK